MRASVLVPASVGNVGPGFDVLGLAVEGLWDRVAVELIEGESAEVQVEGRDAELIPRQPARNCAAVAAEAMLRRLGRSEGVRVFLRKALPLSGGLGGSAASSVGGALAAALAVAPSQEPDPHQLLSAALDGEVLAAGRHLDNIAPAVFGGLTLVRSVDPIDVVRVPLRADWWLALVTPAVRVETKTARSLLPACWERASWVQQMANTAALVWAFASGDVELARRSLCDRFAEPVRSPLIPHFEEVKWAALEAGAFGCSISGSGPTVFALAPDEPIARDCAQAMGKAFGEIASSAHVGRIAKTGARPE